MSLVMNSVGNAPGINIQAFIDLTLLNCDLKGVYQYQVIDAEDEKDKETKTKVLVMPTSAKPQSMTLDLLIKDINKIIQSFGGGPEVSAESMKGTLESMGLGAIANIEVQIRQLFIYVDKSSKPENTKPCEYAFNFVILNPVDPEESLNIFNIKQLGLAVFNTDRKKIIERMQLENIDELLA